MTAMISLLIKVLREPIAFFLDLFSIFIGTNCDKTLPINLNRKITLSKAL